jgi:Flp pilus assembly protein TadG
VPQKNERGAMAVEFALITPILLLLVVGIIEFGILLVNQAMITNASREAARAGIVASNPRPSGTGTGSITSIVSAYLTNAGLNAGSATVTVQNLTTGVTCGATPCCTAFQNDLSVRVIYAYSFVALPSLIASFSTPTLGATTRMKCE